MALQTLAQLEDSIRAWLWDRDDLSGRIPDFIVMAEADFNQELRVRQMEAIDTIVLTAGEGTLPADYLAFRDVYANSSPIVGLSAVDQTWAILKYPETAASDPKYFYISGLSIFTKPVCSSDLIMTYWRAIPSLITNTTGNWLLTASPQAYLYGALLHAAPFLDDDSRVQIWGTLRNEAIAKIQQSDTTAKYARAAGRIRGVTP